MGQRVAVRNFSPADCRQGSAASTVGSRPDSKSRPRAPPGSSTRKKLSGAAAASVRTRSMTAASIGARHPVDRGPRVEIDHGAGGFVRCQQYQGSARGIVFYSNADLRQVLPAVHLTVYL